MKFRIVPGTAEYLADCLEAVQNSDLGRNYASPPELLSSKLAEGFSKGEIFVALDEADQYLGHVWIVSRGAFDSFPYCRILAVKKEHRGRGIGTAKAGRGILVIAEARFMAIKGIQFVVDDEGRRQAVLIDLRVNRFPYGIIYSIEQDEVFILAVMHLRRHYDFRLDYRTPERISLTPLP